MRIILAVIFVSILNIGFAKERIVLTAFMPFAGQTKNNSQNVASEIKKLFIGNNDYDIKICILPVVYDEAAKVALDCIYSDNKKPIMVVSLGESGCKLRFDNFAQNKDNAPFFPDNNGTIRSDETISTNASANIKFSLDVDKIYCAEKNRKIRKDFFYVSFSPGTFVCNNTAFHLMEKLSPQIKYTFIHVPSTKCKLVKDPKVIGKYIYNGLSEIIYDEVKKTKSDSNFNECNELSSKQLKQPMNKFFDIIQYLEKRECYEEYNNRLYGGEN